MYLPNLDARTRALMLEEVDLDITRGALFVSPRLSLTGAAAYATLLKEAIKHHDSEWLENELEHQRRLSGTETRRKPTGGYAVVAMPETAAQTIAESEFNRFYIRAVCRQAIAAGTRTVTVYRAKPASEPRAASQRRIGTQVDPRALLNDLRRNTGVETALGIPGGPNSGLSVRLP